MPTDNYFGQLLIELSDHIKTEVPVLRMIDQDLGQLEEDDYRPKCAFPALLIDFAATTYSELSDLAQMGDVTLVLRLAFAPFSSSEQKAPMNVRQKALNYYALEQKLFEAVQGWNNEFTQPMIRVGADTERRNDSLRVRVLTFTTNYEDYSKLPMTNKVAAPLDLESETEW